MPRGGGAVLGDRARRCRRPARAGARARRAGGGGPSSALVERRRAAPSPACGPSTIAAAIARLSATIGLSRDPLEQRRRAPRISRQSVSSAGAALVVRGGDRRLQLVLADGAARRSLRRAARCPRRSAPRSQSDAVLLVERDQLAVRVRCAPGGAPRSAASARAGRRPRARPAARRRTIRVEADRLARQLARGPARAPPLVT